MNRTVILYLLTRFKDFNEWGQAAILEIVTAKFTEPTEQDVFDILNLLDDRVIFIYILQQTTYVQLIYLLYLFIIIVEECKFSNCIGSDQTLPKIDRTPSSHLSTSIW